MGFLGKKDVGNDKVYMKKIKKYVFDRTGKKSTATTLTGARKEADAAGKLAPTEGQLKGYDQDIRIEVPIRKTLSERLGGKAGKEKRRLKKKRGEVPSTTKTVKVKNAKHAEKLHKKRRGITDKKYLDKKRVQEKRGAATTVTTGIDMGKGEDYGASHGVGYETALGLKPPSAFAAGKTKTKSASTDKSTAKAISGSRSNKPKVEAKEGYTWRWNRGKWTEVRTGKKKTTPDKNDKTSSSSGHPLDVTM